MLSTNTNKMDFLDTLFTQKDFNFLNSLEEEIKLIENHIHKQEKKREIIVECINYFENQLKNINKNNIEPVTNLLEEFEKNFVLVNYNIKSLYNLKDSLTNINTNIINLLVSIESNPNNTKSYLDQANSLSKLISDYSDSCATIKTNVSKNDLTINEFLSKSDFDSILNNIIDKKEISDNISTFENFSNLNSEEENNNIKESNKDISKNSSCDNSETYNNNVLRISEKENKVYLPYSNSEINLYLEQFSGEYSSPKSVIKKEFIFPLSYYTKHPVLARFRETYSLIRDKESKSIMEAMKYAMNLMFSYSLNPAIIAACKTQEQLENYMHCLENNTLDKFTDFEIKFEVSLSKNSKI